MPSIGVERMAQDELARRVWEAMGRPEGCAVVGGYVRDRLLGRPTVDLDLSLAGGVDEAEGPARRLAERHGRRAHLLGTPPHAVWRVELAGAKVELWPRGGLDAAADLERRDFTCNALAWWLPAGPLEDRVGGLADLATGQLRAVSRRNLEDDPLRLLRAARFAAELPGLELETTTRGWIEELAPSLDRAPRERVGQELLRLVAAPAARRGAELLLELGLLGPAAPAGASPDRQLLRSLLPAVERLAVVTHHPLRGALLAAANAARLAPLVACWRLGRDHDLAALGWSRETREGALAAVALLDETLAAATGAVGDRRRLIHCAGVHFPAVVAFAAAVAPSLPWRRWWRLWRSTGAELAVPRPLLSADDVMAATGLAPGPALGAVMREMIAAQVDGTLRTAGGARRWLARRPHA